MMTLPQKLEATLSSPEATTASLIVAYNTDESRAREAVKNFRKLIDLNHAFPYSMYTTELSLVIGVIAHMDDVEYKDNFLGKIITTLGSNINFLVQ